MSANSLGLDLYALFLYRLPRLERDVHLRWASLLEQIGATERTTNTLAQRIRGVMPNLAADLPRAPRAAAVQYDTGGDFGGPSRSSHRL